MIGFIWNLRGAGDDNKKRIIRESIIDKHVDFLGLQETIKQTFTKTDLHKYVVDFFFLDLVSR